MSDHADILHCHTMAYADAVVTERVMAAQLSQAAQVIPDIVPPEIYDMRWPRSTAEETRGCHRQDVRPNRIAW